ncbi:MAG: ester cyclase [Thermoproteota archaeon]|nr:ester cyclase [Thermoproteota archaeon]
MSSSESLKQTVKQLAETFNNLQKRELSYFDFYDDSLITHGFPPNLSNDKEGFKQFIHFLWKAFPDINITFEDIIVDENKVAGRYILSGTHKGEFMGIQPTDNQFKVYGMTVFYFQNAKIVKRWNLVDMVALIEQLKSRS